MSSEDISLPTRLRDALIALEPDRPEAIEALRPLYTDDLIFQDPIQVVHGIDDFMEMNRRLLRRMRRLEWDVHTVKGDDAEAFLEWTMDGATKLGPKVTLEGVTRVRSRSGRIFDHRDYWDLGELLASAIPGGQRILHALRLPLA